MSKPRGLIVGGGIGGLSLGAAMHARDWEVTLVEQTPEWAPVGAGIMLGVNAMNVLRQLGAAETVQERGQVFHKACITDTKGRALSAMDITPLAERFGPSVAIHRAALHDSLLQINGGNQLNLDATIDTLTDDGNGVDVTFSDGTSDRFDCVIGADGIRSKVRELLFGSIPTQYSGYTCWRFVVEMDTSPLWIAEMWGKGRRIGVVPIASDRVYCFTTLNAPENDAAMAEVTTPQLKEMFREFAAPASIVLDAMPDDTPLLHNDLAEIEIPHWTKGRVTLLGDAAHAMTPNMGQGAAMALEDAWVLAECLTQHAVPEALSAYEIRRRPRVEHIQTLSRRIGHVAQWESGVARWIRDSIVRITPDSLAMRNTLELLAAEI